MQERHSQQASLAFTAASQEGSHPVKAFSKAGDLTSMHRWGGIERREAAFISRKLRRSAWGHSKGESGLQTTQGGSPATSHLHMVSVSSW